MTAYYNEFDRFACDWLSNLMDAGLITPGKIDDRSIVDVRPDDLAGYERVHFFAGIGGWDYALDRAGWRAPAWTGSCPCQPFCAAGRRAGFDDPRHLWPVWRDLIRERRPATIFGEQVASASDWLRLVRSDLEAMGYAVGAMPFEAASAGADHLRDRYGFVAHRQGEQVGTARQSRQHEDVRHTAGAMADASSERGRTRFREGDAIKDGNGIARGRRSFNLADGDGSGRAPGRQTAEAARHGDSAVSDGGDWGHEWVIGADGKARRVKSGIRLLVDAFPNRMGLLRGFGNAIDSEAFAQFIAAASEAIDMTQADSSEDR